MGAKDCPELLDVAAVAALTRLAEARQAFLAGNAERVFRLPPGGRVGT